MELNWSRWFRCESSFGLLLVPNQPGVFALAEEVLEAPGPQARRMLAVFEIDEAEDVSRALSRLFAPASPWHERLATSRCYMRYAVVPDPVKRQAATASLRNWLNSQMESAAQVFEQPLPVPEPAVKELAATETERAVDRVMAKPAFPSGF